MIFDSLKLLHVANKLQITAEELFLIQTVYDYQKGNESFDRDYLKELKKSYSEYYEQDSQNWFQMLGRLIEKNYIEDLRRDKTSYNLGELMVSELFIELSGNTRTDEDLFAEAKNSFPTHYYTGYQDRVNLNMNFNTKEEIEVFTSFKKKILSGNRAKNWEQFSYILKALYPEGKDNISEFKFDRFINTFWDNLEQHKKTLGFI